MLPRAPEHAASTWAQGTLGNAILQDALSVGPAASSGLEQLVASELTLAAGGIGGGVAEMGSNQAMLRAMRDSLSMDVEGARAVSTIGSGGGSQLAAEQLTRFEFAFGRDFSHVRIHADGRAAAASEALQAYAFALGAHIYFGRGQFSPGTRTGDRLLAHELTHVVQSDQGRLPSGKTGEGVQVSSPSDPHEREAYGNEVRMLDVLQMADRAIAAGEVGEDAATLDVGAPAVAEQQASAPVIDVATPDVAVADVSAAEVSFDAGLESGSLEGGGDFAPVIAGDLGMSMADAGAPEAPAMLDREGETLDTAGASAMIRNSRGAPLPVAVQQRMAAALGHDFAHVRVHTDAAAVTAAEKLGARAFALGADVFFNAGQFAPGSDAGDHVLAHELTHVKQHDEGRLPQGPSDGLAVSNPSDSAEREAEAMADVAAPALAEMPSSGSELAAMASVSDSPAMAESTSLEGVVHREKEPAEGTSAGGVADEYLFKIGSLERKVKAPAGAKAGADVVFVLGWEVATGLSLTDARVRLGADGKIESGTVRGTFGAEPYVKSGDINIEVGKDGEISAKVRGNYDLGWVAGEFEAEIGADGIKATVPLNLTKPIVDSQGRFVIASADGVLTLSSDGKWSATGTITGTWTGVGTATIKINAENDRLAGEIDLQLQVIKIGDTVEIGPSRVSGKYDSVTGIILEGEIRAKVGQFEADLSGKLELDARGGVLGAAAPGIGAPGAAPAAGAPAAGAPAAGAPAAGGTAPASGAPASGAPASGAPASGGPSTSAPASGGSAGPATAPASEAPAPGAPASGGPAATPAAAGGGKKKAAAGQQAGPGAAGPEKAAVPSVPSTSLFPGGGKLSLPQGATLGGTATLRQTKPIEIEGFTISGGELSIGLEANAFTQVSTNFDYAFEKYTGRIEATLDVATGLVAGKGSCNLSEELAIGDSGAVIKKASGTIEIVDSKPTTMTGTVEIEVPFQDQPTFLVVGSGLIYDFQKAEIGGTVTATTLRAITLGAEDKMHAIIAEGASATGKVEANKLVSIDGALAYSITEPAGEVGTGTITCNFTPEGSLDADANFSLTAEYGIPERTNGPLFLLAGSTFRVTVTAGELEKAALEDVKFEFANPTGEGGIKGSLQGTYTFADGLIEVGTGKAEVAIPWTIRGESWGFITFTEGGSLDVEVKASLLEKLSGNFPYTASINAGDKVLDLEGELKGDYDKESDTFGGELNGTLKNELEFQLEGGARLKILPEATAKITVTKSDFDAVELNFECEYYKAGESEAFLGGKIEKATYDLKTGFIAFDGTIKLMQDVEKKSKDGKWTLTALEDSTVTVEVRESALTKIGGDIKFRVDDEEGEFLNGDLTGLELDVQTFEFSGNLDLKTAREFNFPHKKDEGDVAAYRLNVKKDSKVYGRVEKNDIAEIGAELDFSVDFLQVTECIEGKVKGSWNFNDDEFTGGASAEVKKPFPLAGGQKKDASGKQLESFIIGIVPSSTVDLDIQANKLQRAAVDLTAVMEYNDEDVATGTLVGDYKIGDEENGFSGDASIVVNKRFDWAEGSGDYKYVIEEGTRADGSMTNNVITSANGTFILIGQSKERKRDEWKLDAGGDWSPDSGVSGEGGILILEDIEVGQGDTYTAVLCKDSEATGSITADEFTELQGLVKVRLDEGEKPKLGCEIDVTYTAGADAQITGTADITTLDDFDIGGVGDFKFVLAKDSTAGGAITANELDYIEGDVTINVKRVEAAFGVANVNGKYTHGAAPNFTGKGTFDVTAPETDLGISLPGGMSVFLLAGAGMQAQITDNDLDTLSAGVPLLVKKDGKPFIDVKLEGTYYHKTKKLSGKASGKLIPRVQVGQPVNGYTFFVDPSTGIEAEFTDAGIQSLTGTLKTSVEDAEGLFLTAEGKATWTFGEGAAGGSLDAKGIVLVKRTKVLAGEGATWTVSLKEGSGGEVDIKANELEAVKGNITILVDRDAKPFAEVSFSEGGWTKADGFNGTGETKLLVPEFEMASLSGYTFTLLEGSGGKVVVKSSNVTNIDGQIKIGINKGAEKFMAGELKGDYDFEKKEFNGNGSISVINKQLLASVGKSETLWLIAGSGVEVNISKNDLDKVGGQLTISLEDASPYLTCALKGNYDIKGGTGFTGEGAVDITRRKELLGTDKYKFLLDVGTGAKAKIVENKITEVTGQVPFVVQDPTLDLITGKAEGKYSAETGLFSGTGAVYLGRDLEYPVGSSGLVLKFKKGSGGGGTVTDSKLEKLTGTLNVELWKDGKGIVSCSATGEYDAVNNKIIKATGKGTLLQPIELLSGNVIIADVNGDVVIEDNKLVEAGGKGSITLPKLGKAPGVKGTFGLKWSNRTGKDVYEGTGRIDFTLLDDPAKGRKMSGMVDATYKSDDTFEVLGTVRYDMNEMIGGDLGIKMDQTFNPEITADLQAKGTLVEGRDLFNLDTDLVPKIPVVIFPGVFLEFGVKGGMGLKMRPLTFDTTIGMTGWKPKESAVPTFTADLTMDWGLDFNAYIAAYAALKAGIPYVGSLGAGIRGQVDLRAPLVVKPYASLTGGPAGFGGELGVGVSLKPTASLSIIPYVEAEVIGIKPLKHDFEGATMNLGEIFSFEWGTNYKFGDQSVRTKGPAAAKPVPAPTQDTTTRLQSPPSKGGNSAAPASAAKKGAPQIESGSEVAAQQPMNSAAGKKMDGMDALNEKLDKIKVIAKGLGAFGYLMELLVGCLTALSFGFIGLGLYLVYLYLFKGFSFKKVGQAIKDLTAAVSLAIEILEPMMPEWMANLIRVIKDPPGLMDLFTGDDKARAATRSGDIFNSDLHKDPVARGKLHAECVYQMLDGWTGEDDQECILIILQRGDLNAVLQRVSTGWILDDLDGYEDDEARKLFKSRGIAY